MKLENKCERYIIKRLLNVYCEIFGTRSYGGDALASSCVLRHMNSCQIFHNIHSIIYKYACIGSTELSNMKYNTVVFCIYSAKRGTVFGKSFLNFGEVS